MQDNPRVIKISDYSLEAFAVYNNDFYDVTLLPLAATKDIIIECKRDRKFTLNDLAQVLEKVIVSKNDAAVFFFTWFEPLILHFYDVLKLDRLYGEGNASIEAYRLTMMPVTDDDLLAWMLSYILSLYRDMSLVQVHVPASEYINAEALLRMIDYQDEENMLPVEERHYMEEIKDDFIRELDNDLILKDADRYTKKLFIRYVNELCELNNFNALRIKGFACLGGNSVFKCDFREAARCMEILWKEGGFGYAANTLGFICLEGRLTDGVPDYDQAFRYFSIGHAFGISESTFKLAEMFMEGVCVAKNPEMAASLLEHLYIDARYRFEQEDFEGAFAEAAMHMGQLQLKVFNDNPVGFKFMHDQALDFFLQSKYALMRRSPYGMSHSDRKISEIVDERLRELSAGVKVYKSSYTTSYPGPVRDFLSYRPSGTYSLELKVLKNSKIKITIRRISSKNETISPLTLLTYREFLCCDLTDNVTVTGNEAKVVSIDSDSELIFDDASIESATDGETVIRFFHGNKETAVIKAANFTVRRP